tara:strand:- start:606 stop:755 length:150 start_codon:yes stop_codon:yes gene_type:complete
VKIDQSLPLITLLLIHVQGDEKKSLIIHVTVGFLVPDPAIFVGENYLIN